MQQKNITMESEKEQYRQFILERIRDAKRYLDELAMEMDAFEKVDSKKHYSMSMAVSNQADCINEATLVIMRGLLMNICLITTKIKNLDNFLLKHNIFTNYNYLTQTKGVNYVN